MEGAIAPNKNIGGVLVN